MKTRLHNAKAGGFTLTELLTVVAIMGILGAAASPNITTLVDSQRARSTSSDLFTTLVHARSEAVRRNASVTIAPVNPARWEDGWNIVHPADNNAKLLTHEKVPNTTIDGPANVVYLSNGRVSGASAAMFDVASGATTRCVKLDLSGRPTQLKQACPRPVSRPTA